MEALRCGTEVNNVRRVHQSYLTIVVVSFCVCSLPPEVAGGSARGDESGGRQGQRESGGDP